MPYSSTYRLPIRKPWIYHLLFWLAYYLFATLISLSIHRIYDTRYYLELLSLVLPDMLLVYVNLYILIPVLLLRQRFVLYAAALLAWIFLISSLTIGAHRFYARAGSAIFAAVSDFNITNYAVQFLNSIYLLGLATAIKFLKDWMSQKQLLQEKQKEQVDTELNFLKSQIHPHFFFNTLNNLYSLTLQKSDLAPEVVLKLSDLMSYMLYESGAALVPLDKEISNLENYMALENLRFGQRLCLSFEKEGVTDSIRIPPLILLAFVENSFKHGMNQITGEGRIDISLKVMPDGLVFRVGNPVGGMAAGGGGAVAHGGAVAGGAVAGGAVDEAGPGGADGAATGGNGLGLKNAIRRLDLLYGTRYRLDLDRTANRFQVTLNIPLS